jgi:hypothetical protein
VLLADAMGLLLQPSAAAAAACDYAGNWHLPGVLLGAGIHALQQKPGSRLHKLVLGSWGWHACARAKGWPMVTFLILPPVVPGRGRWPSAQNGTFNRYSNTFTAVTL